MPRLIHLVVKAEYVGPAHWAIYIPSQIDHRNGKLLHVGDTLKVEFVRNYTLPASNEVRSIALLGHIDDSDGNIVDFTACPGAPFVKDHVPQDTVEQIALTIPVPGLTRVRTTYFSPNCKLNNSTEYRRPA